MGAGKGYFTGYPKHVSLILGNEFCERFSFYGMKAILVLFLRDALGFGETTATSLYHGFNTLCYFTPIFGAMLADGFLGKYKTILIISVVYAIGNGIMAIGAIPFDGTNFISAISFTGLLLIAIGTGGIKPCVSAFGADQFEDHQVKQKDTFFSFFYMAINLGSLLSMIITPIIRNSVMCFGDSCYALAFGIPAILMLLAVVLFVAGTRWYKIIPPGENIIAKLFGCIGVALKGKLTCNKHEKRDHWLDYADSKYSKEFVNDMKAVMRVLFMFIPLPIFFSLMEQQGSRWVFQAGQLNGDLGFTVLEPDQVQVINPILVLLLVPFLDSVIFPCSEKIGLPNRPLQRMVIGMVLAGTAFVLTAFLQIGINNNLPTPVPATMAKVNIINTAPCPANLTVTADGDNYFKDLELGYGQTGSAEEIRAGNVTFTADLAGCPSVTEKKMAEVIDLEEGTYYNVIIYGSPTGTDFGIEEFKINKTTRTDYGKATISFINTLPDQVGITFNDDKFDITSLNRTEDIIVREATYDVSVEYVGTAIKGRIRTRAGAVYSIVIYYGEDAVKEKVTFTQYEDIQPNGLHIALQLPQYIVLTFAEVYFYITGLSFAYSQAPNSMKAVMQAGWLLTDAVGNLIVTIITAVGNMPSQVFEFFFFAGLMYLSTIVFIIFSLFYTYVGQTQIDVTTVGDDDDKVTANHYTYDNPALESDEPPSKISEQPAPFTLRSRTNDDVTSDVVISTRL